MTSEVKEMVTRLNKSDIGVPTDFRHLLGYRLGNGYSIRKEDSAPLPLVEKEQQGVSLVDQEQQGVSLVDAMELIVHTDSSTTNEMIMKPSPVAPTIQTKIPPTKRQAPTPPSNTNNTNNTRFTDKLNARWKDFTRKPPSQTETLSSPKNVPPIPSGVPSSDVPDGNTTSTARHFLRKAPPPPPLATADSDNKTHQSLNNIQNMAAMVALKLINRYPEDYADEGSLMETAHESKENKACNIPLTGNEIKTDHKSPEEDMYEVIGHAESDVSEEIQEVTAEKLHVDEDGKNVLMRGSVSHASSRRRHSALKALDLVISSFSEMETDDYSARTAVNHEEAILNEREFSMVSSKTVEYCNENSTTNNEESIYEIINGIKDVEINSKNKDPPGIPKALPRKASLENMLDEKSISNIEESIYEIIHEIKNVESNSKKNDPPGIPKALPRKASVENMLDESDSNGGTQVPPVPAPRRVLQTDVKIKIDVCEETIRQSLSAYIEEFYEDVTPKQVAKPIALENTGSGDEKLTGIKDQDEQSNNVTATLNVGSNNGTATFNEKAAELAASLNDNSVGGDAGSSKGADSAEKHSVLTWDVNMLCTTTVDSVGDRELRLLLMKAGVTDQDLQDSATRNFILQFIQEHGGKDRVKREVMFLTTLAARPNRRRQKKKLLEVVQISIDDQESTYM